MNLRYVVAAALAVAVAAGAPTAGARTDGTDAAKATTLTVWLMTDAQGPDWAAVVSAANRAFEAAHSDVERQGRDPDVGRSPHEARRGPRGRPGS